MLKILRIVDIFFFYYGKGHQGLKDQKKLQKNSKA